MSANRVISEHTQQLFQASEEGNVEEVKRLVLEPDVDINWHKSQSYGATPIIAAIAGGHLEVVKVLLDANVDIGAQKTPDLNTPLHEAVSHGHPEISSLILGKIHSQEDVEGSISERVNFQNQFGNTPLHNAARGGNIDCVKQLLDAGASVSVRNLNGSLPLHHCCYCESPNAEVAKLLIGAGADIEARDERQATPLIVAAKKNQTSVLELLCRKGADKSAQNQFGENAMHFALQRENADAQKLLT